MLLNNIYKYDHREYFVPLKMALWLALVIGLLSSSFVQADSFIHTFHELAPGIWAGVRENSPRLPVMGSTMFVVSEAGVVVFDGGGMPLMAERVIAKIRSVTDKPVTHIIISHWHGDHNLGISAYLKDFPSLQIVGHEFTRAAMLGSPMDYARDKDRVSGIVAEIKEIFDAGVNEKGEPIQNFNRQRYQMFLDDAELIDKEFHRAEIIPPTITFNDRLVIHSGSRIIELLFLGHANTAGDVVMWLPNEKIVAAGDMVVYPTPYGYNVPPRAWAETLRKLNALGFVTLVPGHGAIQHDMLYVDLLIETAVSIADQRDSLLATGLNQEEAAEKLDFSHVTERFTHGDDALADRFEEWFARPFRKAVFKAMTGEPMVVINPKKNDDK